MIGLQPLERFIHLAGGGRLGAPVHLAHQEHLLPVAVAQGVAHTNFADAAIVVPAIIHKGDAAVDELRISRVASSSLNFGLPI